MTRTVPFTQASIGRAVKAARKAGLRVTGISATGTVQIAPQGDPAQDARPSKWSDIQT
jgi:hypothetical protein